MMTTPSDERKATELSRSKVSSYRKAFEAVWRKGVQTSLNFSSIDSSDTAEQTVIWSIPFVERRQLVLKMCVSSFTGQAGQR